MMEDEERQREWEVSGACVPRKLVTLKMCADSRSGRERKTCNYTVNVVHDEKFKAIERIEVRESAGDDRLTVQSQIGGGQ
jgi:hypothetical protein